jgi:hypothetical protein
MSQHTQIRISAEDLAKALTWAFRRKVDPKADVGVEVRRDRLVVSVSNISKNVGWGPLSTDVNVKGDVLLHTEPSPVPGTIALAWSVSGVGEIIRPLVEMFVQNALLELDALRGAVLLEHTRRGLCVVNPALVTINATKLGDVMNIVAVTVPGPEGAALAIEGSLGSIETRG